MYVVPHPELEEDPSEFSIIVSEKPEFVLNAASELVILRSFCDDLTIDRPFNLVGDLLQDNDTRYSATALETFSQLNGRLAIVAAQLDFTDPDINIVYQVIEPGAMPIPQEIEGRYDLTHGDNFHQMIGSDSDSVMQTQWWDGPLLSRDRRSGEDVNIYYELRHRSFLSQYTSRVDGNGPSLSSYRPGDVLYARGGKNLHFVNINQTDETLGRLLILVDDQKPVDTFSSVLL